jgi:hypothetical protein
MLNRIKLQLLLAMFWFISAYLAIGAVLPWEWAWRCGWLNVIIGLVGLLLITITERGDRLFYKGPEGEEPGSLRVGLLWAIPIVGLLVAGLWWFLRLLGIFN